MKIRKRKNNRKPKEPKKKQHKKKNGSWGRFPKPIGCTVYIWKWAGPCRSLASLLCAIARQFAAESDG